MLGTLAVILIPELLNDGFYYADDVRHYFMPQVMDIGARLDQGEMPWMTIRSWFGGNYVGEGVLSLFNPINLGLYWLGARIGDPETAALLFAGAYLQLTALGVYLLARAYGAVRHWAIVAALAYCSSGFLMYWYAATWWNALVGICWLTWTWVGWRNFVRSGRLGVVAFLGTFLLLISGWPHGAIMGILIVLVELHAARDRFIGTIENPARGVFRISNLSVDLGRVFSVLGLALCAAGASLLSIVPAYLHAAESARSAWGVSGGTNWVGSLDYLIAAGWPSYLGASRVFFNGEPSFPSFYLAWFVPPVLLMLFGRQNRLGGLGAVVPLLVIAGIASLLSFGPGQLFVLRWPLRFLTFGHIALIVAACVSIPRLNLLDRNNKRIWVWYVAAGTGICILADPEIWPIHLAFGGVTLLAFMIVVSGLPEGPRRAWAAGAFLLLLHLLIHMVWPQNQNVGRWPAPTSAFVSQPESMSGNSRVVLMRSEYPCHEGECPLASGNIGLWEAGRALNGYSPTGSRPYHSILGFNIWSWTEPQSLESLALAAYFTRDTLTDKRRHELMRVDEFRIAGPVLPRMFEQVRAGSWESHPLPHGTLYRTSQSISSGPGTVSWTSPGIRLASEAGLSSLRESIEIVENLTSQDARIIFARAWHPGYEAHLDGQPLQLEKYWDFLVGAIIPPGRTGEVTLRYRPAGISWTAPLAALCALLALAIALHARRRG